jgi:hypothetical protein
MKIFVKHFKKLLIIPFLILSGSANAEFRHFNDWSKKEKALFISYGTVGYIDHRQTRVALSDPCECYSEANPLYGSTPHADKSIAINLAAMGVIYWAVGSFEEDKLNPYLLGATLGRTAVVIHNDSIGIDWRVAF